MKAMELNSNQIIALNDYPVYSETVLIKYFNKCKSGEKMPLIPVVSADIVKKYFDNALLKVFEKFKNDNPMARYFMLDGNHRATALTLNDCKIGVVIYKKDEDIVESKKLVVKGQVLKNKILNCTLQENCEILNDHFKKNPYFMTVEQKTNKMIKEKLLSCIYE